MYSWHFKGPLRRLNEDLTWQNLEESQKKRIMESGLPTVRPARQSEEG